MLVGRSRYILIAYTHLNSFDPKTLCQDSENVGISCLADAEVPQFLKLQVLIFVTAKAAAIAAIAAIEQCIQRNKLKQNAAQASTTITGISVFLGAIVHTI